MSNGYKPLQDVVGRKIRHDFSRNMTGKITKTRLDIRGYCYFVEWDLYPEQNDWYQLNVLEKIEDLDG